MSELWPEAALDRVDAVVVGAGVLGLAVGRALAQRGLETLVLERAAQIGSGISSRSSEVIHAGLYYPSGSLKAELCVRGRELLYDFCALHAVPHRRCGKLLVATEAAQLPALLALAEQARRNGVDDVQALSAAQARALEPALRCEAALLSPSTGIVDSHALMLALQGDLEAVGGCVALGSAVGALRRQGELWRVEMEAEAGGDEGESFAVLTPRVVNAAGLWAPALARATEGLAARHQPAPRYCKGSYFSLSGRAPFSHLIYPMPQAAGLGVHLTLDLGGQARFGPDVEWLDGVSDPDALDYRVDPARGERFAAEVRRYWPDLPEGRLQAAYAGVRPKISAPGEPAADFRIEGPAEHGLAGLVQLLGLESPGLTSCLAVAERVSALLD
ncbi:NAD(P)/FAD-dependent oxidoreductase [Kinneretia aquatilis]|uniref:NAD(P)/FAD-dependent oxidoreductase n=1 Tax=Kinneretia aquatilis TaxID=2070761 RepID=UPI00149517FC|nr:NAD(P)/FAD-dependent oxidoreductase [Paucibacter aquatile]WIV99652.1 NAD(P)/FAD-dependent oxidoreductase [Paucibacter aquatile]